MNPLAIALLVHNDFSHIYGAIDSIRDNTQITHELYIVINQGTTEDIDKLQTTYPDCNYIVNNVSKGFAANHNQILRRVENPYVALLNDDIVVHENALDMLVSYLEAHQTCGIVAPQLQYADSSPQVTVYSDPNLPRMVYKISGLGRFTHQQSTLRKWLVKSGLLKNAIASLRQYTEPQNVEVVKAAAIIVRKAAVDAVGYIDETTKAYGEEVDWNLRMRQAGWDVAIVPQAIVTHFGTGQALMELRGWQIIEDRKSILNYFLNHKPLWQSLVIRVAIVIFHFLQLLVAIPTAPDQIKSHFETMKLGLFWRQSASQ